MNLKAFLLNPEQDAHVLVVLGFHDGHSSQRAAAHGSEGKLVGGAMGVDLVPGIEFCW